MLKKHLTLIGITASLLLLFISTSYYPGGSQQDKNTIGYDMKNNYLCNLFNEKAVNGMANPSRPWAVLGMFVLCVSFAAFFIRFSKKIPSKSSAHIIKYAGISAMFFAFLVTTAYHDIMTTIGSIFYLLAIFYISVYVFMSKLFWLKILSIACLLTLYINNYIYYSGNGLDILPIMQKISLGLNLTWIMVLEYFTQAEDFVAGAKK